MKCPQCQVETPTDAAFCPKCGTRLAVVCAQCGAANAPDHNFCKQCGQPLAAAAAPHAKTEPGVSQAERRQLTVMFCDLAGSTALSERLDPEELRDVVRSYQEACAKVISHHEGHIAQYLGDGLLVYFGYPRAHEDDAQRAVRTGLGIVDAMGRLNARLQQERGVRLEARVGVHTGLVVVGEIGAGARHEQLAMGETPNLAARLQELADPGTVVVSAATRRLVQELFTFRELGARQLKGVSTPLSLYQVLGESAIQSPLETALTERAPLVGREEEMGLLIRRWEQVKDGLGQVVLLSGEAGIGKSRLVQNLKARIATEPHTLLECRCSLYHQNSALYPVIDLLQRALRFEGGDGSAEKVHKLETTLSGYRLNPTETIPLLASLLSLALPSDRYPSLTLTAERQRQKTLEAVLTLFVELATQRPVLFVMEDLHWVDPSTLTFLSLLVDQAPTVRLFILFTCRPAFQVPWIARAHLTLITLSRLPRHQVKQLVERVAGGKPLPAEVLHEVVTKTDGVPLFVEELTKMVLESGLLREREDHYELTGLLPPLAIPSTLQDSLMARLDRLATVKAVAQLGATIGRQFSYELLHAVAPLDETTLQEGLRQLIEAELLYQRGVPPHATYIFKHALIQDAAYQSLLKSTRQEYHQRIAHLLTERFAEIAQTQPELLAHHLTEAGLSKQAIAYWQKAGQRASERSANVEAIAHLAKGLELLKAFPDTPERAQQELDLQTTLGPALMAAKSYAAPEVEKAYARARELCQQLGETPQLYTVLRGLWGFYIVRAELRTAHDLGKECLALAERAQNPPLILWARYALGMTLFHLGELASAREHFELGIALYDPQKRRSHRALQDPGVACLSYKAVALRVLGYADQALKTSREALTLAHKLSHPFSLNYALNIAAVVCQLSRNVQEAQEQAEAANALATEHGIPYWLAWGAILGGWALTEQGRAEEGIRQQRQGIAAYSAAGAGLAQPYFLALLAEAYGKAGQAEEGLTAVAEALALMEKTGERWWEAELHRLKGELLLAVSSNNYTEAGACFYQALDLARRQSAKSMELRAAMSLCRLWQTQGKKEEARQMLAEVYGWFTEGFDARDLKEARLLLAELAGSKG